MRKALALLFVLVGTYAQAQTVGNFVRLDGEWDDYNLPAIFASQGDGILSTYCDTPTSRGTSTRRFPKGGLIYGYRWQATAHRPGHVLLANLAILSANGSIRFLHNDLLTHKAVQTEGQQHDVTVTLPLPVRLRPGDAVFIGVYGWGGPCEDYCSVLEVQAGLWVEADTQVVP